MNHDARPSRMKLLLKFLTIGSVIYLTWFLFSQRLHASEFPISQLGNCRNARECHLFCEIPTNKATCWSYSVYGNGSQVLGDETPETKVGALGITFPIEELGGCTSVTACKAFCNITQNQATCQSFAQSHGLTKKEKIVEKAQSELGCASAQECKAFCEEVSNQEACRNFAKKYHLKAVTKNTLLEAAQSELGCTSQESCKELCAQAENREKCTQLARRLSPNHGETRKEQLVEIAKEKLGCTSFEDCKAFCQNETNKDQCKSFGQAVGQQLGERIKQKIQEIGNCTTVDECRKVCAENPGKCPDFPSFQNKQSSPSGQRPLQKTDTRTQPFKPGGTIENKQELKAVQQKVGEQKLPQQKSPSQTASTSATQ